jgi:hypothetical protein
VVDERGCLFGDTDYILVVPRKILTPLEPKISHGR